MWRSRARLSPAVPVIESLRDDLRQHADNVLIKLATVTLVLVTVTAHMEGNTNLIK